MVQSDTSGSRIRDSPSVQMTLVLIIVYLLFGAVGGDFFNLNLRVAFPFVQVNFLVWKGWVWMLFTAMFLHANLLHLFGNVMFLLVFGVALEERVSRIRWLITYLASGLTGNLAFLFLGAFLEQGIGLGASGAIYGLLGAAGGIRGAFLVILVAGLNIFSGGGTLAHLGGLVTGLILYQWGDDLARFFNLKKS